MNRLIIFPERPFLILDMSRLPQQDQITLYYGPKLHSHFLAENKIKSDWFFIFFSNPEYFKAFH
jgi:hypothetical protein